MPRINLSVTPDGTIEEILERTDDGVRALVNFDIPTLAQRSFFGEVIRKNQHVFDLRSRFARVGYDSSLLGIEAAGRGIKAEVELSAYTTQFFNGFDWRYLLREGMEVGKLVSDTAQQVPGVQEICDALESGRLRLNSGSRVFPEDAAAALRVHNIRYKPDPAKIREAYLDMILSGAIPRQEMVLLQPPQRVEGIVVPANDGIVTRTSIRPSNFSLLVYTNQKRGIRHTSAVHVQPDSAEELFLEFIGNGKENMPIDEVLVALRKEVYEDITDKPRPTRTYAQVQTRARNGHDSVYVVSKNNRIWHSPYKGNGVTAGKELLNNLHSRKPGYDVYMDRFAGGATLDAIVAEGIYGRVRSVTFKQPSNPGGFTSGEFDRMVQLTGQYGMQLYWEQPDGTRQEFHRVAFMNPEDKVCFDKAVSSNSIAAAFGSSMLVREEDIGIISDAMRSYGEFIGGEGYIINGGGPEMMTKFSELAGPAGLKVGTINILKPGDTQVSGISYSFPFNHNDINTRQGNLIDYAGVHFFFNGGYGTLYELFEVLTKAKLFRQTKPVIIFGEEEDILTRIMGIVGEPRYSRVLPDYVRDNVHILKDGSQVKDTLMAHYHLGDARRETLVLNGK